MAKKKEKQAKRAVLTESGRVKLVPFTYPEPTKLSKAGEWRKAHPNGILQILDLKAVLE